MSDVIDAIKRVYYLNNGKDYDRVALLVLQTYKRGGRQAVTSLLQHPEYRDDPCAKIFREYLRIKTISRANAIFSFCKPQPNSDAPAWVGGHGWRLKRWPGQEKYIHPTPTKGVPIEEWEF